MPLDTNILERRLGDNFGDLYALSDGKQIVKALLRLRGGEPAGSYLSAQDDLRTAWVDIVEAAETLFIDLEWRVKDLMGDVNAATAQAISEAIGEAHASHRRAASIDRDRMQSKPIHQFWQFLGKSKKPEWRPILKELGRGKNRLRYALKKHPPVRYALRLGMLETGLAHQAGPRWLHWLEEAVPATMKTVVSTARNIPGLEETPGRPDQSELIDFTRRIIGIAERYSGTEITASMHLTKSRTTDKIQQNINPGIDFVYACVKPLYPPATRISCASLIRKAKKRP